MKKRLLKKMCSDPVTFSLNVFGRGISPWQRRALRKMLKKRRRLIEKSRLREERALKNFGRIIRKMEAECRKQMVNA